MKFQHEKKEESTKKQSLHFLLLILFCVILLATTLTAPVIGSYGRNITFGTIKISYEELNRVVSKIHNFTEQANADYHDKNALEKMTLSDGKRTITLRNQLSLQSVKELPAASYRLLFSYENDNQLAPITSVQLDFSDSSRNLSVEGNNFEQVDALFSLLSEQMNTYSFYIGGPMQRTLGGFACLIILFLALLFLMHPNVKAPGKLVVSAIIFSLVFLILLLALPFNRWLPGFLLYDPKAAFLPRNSPIFTFLGFILTTLPFIISGLRWLLKKRKEADQKEQGFVTKLEEIEKKVEEVQNVASTRDQISDIEGDLRKLANDFFDNKTTKIFSKKKDEIEIATREARLNKEWGPVYSFLIDGLNSLVGVYNTHLPDNEKISLKLPEMPRNLFSTETDNYKGEITFHNGREISIYCSVSRPLTTDVLPSLYFDIRNEKKEMLVRAAVKMDAEKKHFRVYEILNKTTFSLKEFSEPVVLTYDNYQTILLNFLKNLIEYQLVS